MLTRRKILGRPSDWYWSSLFSDSPSWQVGGKRPTVFGPYRQIDPCLCQCVMTSRLGYVGLVLRDLVALSEAQVVINTRLHHLSSSQCRLGGIDEPPSRSLTSTDNPQYDDLDLSF